MPSTPDPGEHAAPQPVGLAQAFVFWLKLGFISFSGPAGQIALMHQELVERRRWISEKRFLHALNYCMLRPGPEAQQLATYIGWLMHRTWGGVVAGALFVLPSLFILVGLSWVYIAFGDVGWVAGIFYGIKPAVTAIVLQAAHRIGSRSLKNKALWGIAAASFVAIFTLQVPFPLIVLGSGQLFMAGALAGGPLVESTHNNLTFTAPLTGITAAVVGVIVNLTLFFGYHVLWPQGFAGAFDGVAAAIALAAAVALFRYQSKVVHVIAASALLGLLLSLSR